MCARGSRCLSGDGKVGRGTLLFLTDCLSQSFVGADRVYLTLPVEFSVTFSHLPGSSSLVKILGGGEAHVTEPDTVRLPPRVGTAA